MPPRRYEQHLRAGPPHAGASARDALPRRPGLVLRLRVRRTACRLDRSLAAGWSPSESAELELRVGQLGSAHVRWMLARRLRSRIERAERRGGMALPRRDRAVLDARDALRALADAVTDPGHSGVRGIALACCLVRDLRRPRFARPPGDELAERARHAIALMHDAS